MGKRIVEDVVSEMAGLIVERHKFELVDVEFIKEGANWYLRIYIDKRGGITIDDCQVVSEEMSELLDKNDPIPQSYILEVSSPGLDRPLKKESDFERYRGEAVELRFFQPIDGKKQLEGELVGLIDGNIVIKDQEGSDISFERDKVAIVKRVIKF